MHFHKGRCRNPISADAEEAKSSKRKAAVLSGNTANMHFKKVDRGSATSAKDK